MSGLNLKSEILVATSFENFKERIRGSINNNEYYTDDWVRGIGLLREAHKMNIAYRAFEQCTSDKEQLETCMEILEGLDNLYCLNDKKKAESVHRMQSSIWKDVISLKLARTLMDEVTKDREGYKIDFKVEKILDKQGNRDSLNFLVDTLMPYNTFSVNIHLDVLVEAYTRASVVVEEELLVWSNLQSMTAIKHFKKLYNRYLTDFPFDTEGVIRAKIIEFSNVIEKELANEICFLYLAYEKNMLGEADEKRLIELLFALAITNRFGFGYYDNE